MQTSNQIVLKHTRFLSFIFIKLRQRIDRKKKKQNNIIINKYLLLIHTHTHTHKQINKKKHTQIYYFIYF